MYALLKLINFFKVKNQQTNKRFFFNYEVNNKKFKNISTRWDSFIKNIEGKKIKKYTTLNIHVFKKLRKWFF